MNKWENVRFENAPLEIIDGDRGVNYPKQSDFMTSGHCLFLNAGNVTEIGFDFSDCSFISEANDNKLRKGKLARYDIVLTTRGTVGNLAFYDDGIPFENIRLNSGMVIIRPNKERIFPRYLYFSLKSSIFKEQVSAYVTGSAQPQLPIRDINRIEFPLPPLAEQRAIAGILGALDDKIEVNRNMNITLESIAKTVFGYCFLRNIDVDTWEVKTLGDVLAVLETGSRPKGGVTQEPIGTPSVGAESIVKIGSFDYSKTKYVSNEFYESMRRGHIEDRDVLLYKDGGRPGEFEPHVSMFGDGFPFEKFSINEHVYRMRVTRPLSQAYFYFWLESDEIMEEMRSRGTGVAIPGLNSTALSGISISIPPEKLLNEFSDFVEPLISKMFANAKESRTLGSLRDSLLPKLMRGEVRVKEVEG